MMTLAATARAQELVWSTGGRRPIADGVDADMRVVYANGQFRVAGQGGRYATPQCVVPIDRPVSSGASFTINETCSPYDVSATFTVSNWRQSGGTVAFTLSVAGRATTDNILLKNQSLSYAWNVSGNDPQYAAQQAAERQRQAQIEAQQREAERVRQADAERIRQAEAERLRLAEAERVRQAQLAQDQEAERQRQAQMEKARQAQAEQLTRDSVAAAEAARIRDDKVREKQRAQAEVARGLLDAVRNAFKKDSTPATPTPTPSPVSVSVSVDRQLVSQQPEATDRAAVERDCYNRVQGRIAWDAQGTTKWADANVNALCRGTQAAAAPGRCFTLVRHGGIARTDATPWPWEDAVVLCAGAGDAVAPVQCFEDAVRQRLAVAPAIEMCRKRQ